jgi:hypothetical protein
MSHTPHGKNRRGAIPRAATHLDQVRVHTRLVGDDGVAAEAVDAPHHQLPLGRVSARIQHVVAILAEVHLVCCPLAVEGCARCEQVVVFRQTFLKSSKYPLNVKLYNTHHHTPI